MADRGEVVRALECLSRNAQDGSCNGCAYFRPFRDDPDTGWCDDQAAMADALALLREQEPEIIRCKDCKYWHDPMRCQMDSEGMKTPGDWFCADAERR